VLNPAVWRKRFKPLTQRFIDHVHEQGLYAGVAIDGNSRDVLDDLPEMKVDVFTVFDIKTTGLNVLRGELGGKVCVKATVDMQTSLAVGSPQDVAREADELVKAFHTPQGGFIAQVVRWHRPEYPAANVQASVKAFNAYRQGNGS
jgi:uroporphyrinogen-III decarboxylase